MFVTHFPHLQLVPMDVDLAGDRAGASETGFGTPDAIQVAASRLHHANAIVTNDLRWRGRVVHPELILLDDYLGRDADP